MRFFFSHETRRKCACERAKKKKIQEESSLAMRHKKRVCKVLQFERQGSMVAIYEYSLESLFHHPHAT